MWSQTARERARYTSASVLDSMAEENYDQIRDSLLLHQEQSPKNLLDEPRGAGMPLQLRRPRSNRPKSKERRRLHTQKLVARYIAPCMNSYGMCIVDNFLGDKVGERVLQEVKRIDQRGIMRDGQLVSQKQDKNKGIRGDKIAWVSGTESDCQNIGFLLSRMDRLITCADGKMDKFKIRGRHKDGDVGCTPSHGACMRLSGSSMAVELEHECAQTAPDDALYLKSVESPGKSGQFG
ncbi:hypothetical protein DNTS_009862 [Danionella cerebrum]|uniref:Uncharacterized protein n=1 Tax=Danionella cerebrum TaxID=2873325 RepID=A0A553R6N7_9TELE|nr:hypothetical protein DNTS_009862 [Danionella translucida]